MEETFPGAQEPMVEQQSPVTIGSVRGSAISGLVRLTRVTQGWRFARPDWRAFTRVYIPPLLEVCVIVLWALFVTKPYLNLDPQVIPTGREYISAIQGNHVWTWVRECGLCAMWNGGSRGGTPAFVDIYSGMLHPLVIVTTLGWGVLNGAKIALVGAFIMAGVAQWWLGHVLNLGRVARLWSSCMVVAAGHLAGRMQIGVFGVVLSTAACALVFPALIGLIRTGSRRYVVALGITIGLALLAGQGYMQIGLAFTLLAIPLLLPWDRERLLPLARRGGFALCLAILIAGIFLVPFLHFLPSFVKDGDPEFNSSQAFAYIPLNLVINDPDFFNNTVLKQQPYPYLYTLYIGWIPVLLAVWGLGRKRTDQDGKTIAFLVTSAVLAFWIASAAPLAWLSQHAPTPRLAELFTGIRNPILMAGLAIPPLLALAGMGLDRLLASAWVKLGFTFSLPSSHSSTSSTSSTLGTTRLLSFDTRWLLVIPLLIALISARQFTTNWISTEPIDPHVDEVLSALRTPDLQWVNPPFGEHYWLENALSMHLKLGIGIRPWGWRDRPLPPLMLEAARNDPSPDMTTQKVVQGIKITAAPPGHEYAAITHSDGSRTVCTAQGIGGNIDVQCNTPQPGTLQVEENSWSGWGAQVDGHSATLLRSDQWLTVEVPAGSHAISFRYRPWDVPLGLLLSLLGIVLAVYMWLRADAPAHVAQAQDVPSEALATA